MLAGHEIEARSIRLWVRRYEWCPEEVRIYMREGTFERPSLQISVRTDTTAAVTRDMFQITRGVSMSWFAPDQDSYEYCMRSEAVLMSALRRASTQKEYAIPLWDFEANESQNALIVPESPSSQIVTDGYGVNLLAVDWRYTINVHEDVVWPPQVTAVQLRASVPPSQ